MNTEKCLFCGSKNIRWTQLGIEKTNTGLSGNKLTLVNCNSLKCMAQYMIETVENHCVVYTFKRLLNGKLKGGCND